MLTLLALPVGALFGYALSAAIATTVQSEVYRIPLYVSREAVASSFLGIIAAALVSGAPGAATPRRSGSDCGPQSSRVGQPSWRRLFTNVRVIIVVLIIAAIAAAAMWPESIAVDQVAVARGPMQVTIDEEGETRVRDRFVVSAPVMGRLQRIELEPGDAVAKGKIVARLVPVDAPLLDPRARAELAAAIDAARSALTQATAERDRAAANLQLRARPAQAPRAAG